MAEARVERRLAAILAADVAGYSRLMGNDEEGTLAALKACRRELIDPKITEHRGRIVKATGDGVLVEFGSIVDAVQCSVDCQRGMLERNTDVPPEKRVEFRIGINIGDIIIDSDDIHGDGVNIAARLEALAQPGGICVSQTVINHIRGKVAFDVTDSGEQLLKNIARPVHVVIARNSTFTYKGRAIDVKQVGSELGVRYVLEGSVRKAGDRLRITGQLIDAITGAHLWADRFDGVLEDVFDLQDRVAISVAGVIEPALQAAEVRRAEDRPTNDLAAYDLYLRALAHTFSWERSSIICAIDLLEQAIKRDPRYGPALALAAFCYQNLHVNDWSEEKETVFRLSVDLARRALRVAGDDPYVLATVAFVFGYFEENINPAIALIDRSLDLNPSSAYSWARSGWLRLWAGQLELAIEHFETCLRLNPRRRAPSLIGIGVGHFFARRFDASAGLLLGALQENPNWAPSYRFLASCYAQMGRLDEARKIIERLRSITPIVVPSTAAHWRNPELRSLYLDGLRLAVGGEAT